MDDLMDIDLPEHDCFQPEASVESSQCIQFLPPEILWIIIEYLTQGAQHNLLRVCKRFYFHMSPVAWRKVIVAPCMLWVDDRIDTPVPGSVRFGFHRTSRLVNAYHSGENLLPHRFCCVELVICEVMYRNQFAELLEMFPNITKLKLYMGNYLQWHFEQIHDQEFNYKMSQLQVTEPSQAVPRFTYESALESLSAYRTLNRHSMVRHLEIETEAHLVMGHDRQRHVLRYNFAHWLKDNAGVDPFQFFDAFPAIEKLTCPSWFLEALSEHVCWNKRLQTTIPGFKQRIIDKGIVWPFWDFWSNLKSLTIMSYEETYPETHPVRYDTIVEHGVWTFLSQFRSLKTIRGRVGSWKCLHRYPGGFDIVPREEGLVTLAALWLCHLQRDWDVKLDPFEVNVRDLHKITDPESPDDKHVPPYAYLDTVEEALGLFNWLGSVGWTGCTRIPDCTDWWDGPTWRGWFEGAPEPPDDVRIPTLSEKLDRDDPTDPEYMEWTSIDHPGYTIKDAVLKFFEVLDASVLYNMACREVNLSHHVAWYRGYLHPRYRAMSPSKVGCRAGSPYHNFSTPNLFTPIADILLTFNAQ